MQKYSYLLHWICDKKKSKYGEIKSVNNLCLIFNEVNVYFEQINRNKFLTLVPTNESKVKIKKIWRTVD